MSSVWKNILNHERHELKFGDILIVVEDGVFTPDPCITYSTSMILDNMPLLKGMRVADVGTGTGIIAIEAVLNEAAEVVATDISSVAVQNAIFNSEKNNVGNKIKMVKTSLLNGIDGKFDFIFANIPILDEAWDVNESEIESTTKKLLESAKEKLSEDGKIYIPWGSFAEKGRKNLEGLILENGYQFTVQSKEALGYMWYLYIISEKI